MLKWQGCFRRSVDQGKRSTILYCRGASRSSLPKSNYTGGDARVSEDDKHSNTNLRRFRDLFFFGYLPKANKYTRNPVFRCTSSPPFPISVVSHHKASLNASELLSQLRNRHGPILSFRFMFLGFSKGALIPNYNNTCINP